jgi:hypothetical protein
MRWGEFRSAGTGRGAFLRAVGRVAPEALDDLADNVLGAGGDVATWQERWLLTDDWITDAADSTITCARGTYEDAKQHQPRLGPRHSSGVVFERYGHLRELPPVDDRTVFLRTAVRRHWPGYAVQQEPGRVEEWAQNKVGFRIDGWQIHDESRAQAEARMRWRFEEMLGRYLDTVEAVAAEAGLERTAPKRAPGAGRKPYGGSRQSPEPDTGWDRHYEWLARYQVLELTQAEVAAEYRVSEKTVQKTLGALAAEIGLTLRPRTRTRRR